MTMDGVSVEFDDYWFNVRPSNTEPLLRLNLEAKNEEILEEIAFKTNKLKKKGEANIEAAARQLLKDWQTGRIKDE